MPGRVLIAATHRLEFSYVVAGLTHKFHLYCDASALGGDPSGWGLVGRTGTVLGVTTVVTGWYATLANLFNNTVSFAQALLQSRAGQVWIPLVVVGSTFPGGSSVATQLAGSLVVVGKGVGNERFVAELLETIAVPPFHYNTGNTGFTALAAFSASFTSAGANPTTTDPYNWARTRADQLLGRVVGVTAALNKRVRRRRGLT